MFTIYLAHKVYFETIPFPQYKNGFIKFFSCLLIVVNEKSSVFKSLYYNTKLLFLSSILLLNFIINPIYIKLTPYFITFTANSNNIRF